MSIRQRDVQSALERDRIEGLNRGVRELLAVKGRLERQIASAAVRLAAVASSPTSSLSRREAAILSSEDRLHQDRVGDVLSAAMSVASPTSMTSHDGGVGTVVNVGDAAASPAMVRSFWRLYGQ